MKFRRQHPIGPYYADFACPSERIVIEVDGEGHLEAYDLHRDAWLASHGWSVIHVPVQDLDEHFDDVVESLYARLHPGEDAAGESRFAIAPPA